MPEFAPTLPEFVGAMSKFAAALPEFVGALSKFTGALSEFAGALRKFVGATSKFAAAMPKFAAAGGPLFCKKAGQKTFHSRSAGVKRLQPSYPIIIIWTPFLKKGL
jgi:hypothetical protein